VLFDERNRLFEIIRKGRRVGDLVLGDVVGGHLWLSIFLVMAGHSPSKTGVNGHLGKGRSVFLSENTGTSPVMTGVTCGCPDAPRSRKPRSSRRPSSPRPAPRRRP